LDLANPARLCLSLGALAASHVALVAGLLGRGPRARAVLALLVPPLAPIWGLREKLGLYTGIWIGAFALHVVCLIAASIGR